MQNCYYSHMSHEHILARRNTLKAMGITVYAARYPLPGAAASPILFDAPLAVEPTSAEPASEVRRSAQSPAREMSSAPEVRLQPAASSVAPTQAAAEEPKPTPPPISVPANSTALAPFTLAAIALGGCLWLEELPDGVLGRDQVELMRGMCRALGWPDESPAVHQFAWPMHRNPQFDQGPDAAFAALSAFVQRQMAACQSSRLVLLGQPVQDLLRELSPAAPVLRTPATRDMLRSPLLKRDAWRDLRRQ